MEHNDGYMDLIAAAYDHPDGFEVIENSKHLNNRQKHILLAYYRDGKSYAEIGKELDIVGERVRQIAKHSMDSVRMTLYCACMTNIKRQEYQQPVLEYEGMSVRSRNALMRNKLTSAAKIMEFLQKNNDLEPEKALMQMRNVGRKSAREIYQYLMQQNLFLPAVIERGKKVA